MIEVSPVPLYWRITDLERKALRDFQENTWGYVLEIPNMPNPEAYRIAPIILTTEQADRLLRQAPRHPKRVI